MISLVETYIDFVMKLSRDFGLNEDFTLTVSPKHFDRLVDEVRMPYRSATPLVGKDWPMQLILNTPVNKITFCRSEDKP